MMEAVRTSETSVDNHFTRQYNPEDSSEHHTRRRENLKSHDFQIGEYVCSAGSVLDNKYVRQNAVVTTTISTTQV
jgi:hypothetical protein